MTAKNALLFFLAVFGIVFIGLDACVHVFKIDFLSQLQGSLWIVGAIMLVGFLVAVLGVGFVLKAGYIVVTSRLVMEAFKLLLVKEGEFVNGLILAGISVVLLALIPTIFLRKK